MSEQAITIIIKKTIKFVKKIIVNLPGSPSQ
jgi:hypothetical protein